MSETHIACIAEGSAEKAIIDILLDSHLLIFQRENLIEEQVLRCRSAETFERRYLRKDFGTTRITIFRILDSRRENFRIGKAYRNKVDIVNVVTAPEIEMLVVLSENKYEAFKKSGQKPSEFCKSQLKYHDVKNYDFVSRYFSDAQKLVRAIKEYARVAKIPKGERSLSDLLRPQQK